MAGFRGQTKETCLSSQANQIDEVDDLYGYMLRFRQEDHTGRNETFF